MGRSLVIVESPAKAKTINKYLGTKFIVKSSIGHIRDLPTSSDKTDSAADAKARAVKAARTRQMGEEEKTLYKEQRAKEQLVTRMGVDPENGWKARYEILPGKEKVIAELKSLAKDADAIYLATDLDREGEAIAWHLREVIGGDPAKYRRVVFNEITKKAIEGAFTSPGTVDMHRVNAQQARRFLDRVVGFMLSPLLWTKIARGLSAGRVQSVAVRLLVEREREIHAFKPDEYWELRAETTTAAGKAAGVGAAAAAGSGSAAAAGAALVLEVKKKGEAAFQPVSEKETMAAVADLERETFTVSQREEKPVKSNPQAPFITSTLQQAASTRLGFSVKKTMTMAQRLYEAGYISYMRTDSTHLSDDAVQACRSYIAQAFGPRYLPEAPVRYASKEGAQEAHEAIRPSDVTIESSALKGMERDAERLYDLIRRQFMACQMKSAEYKSTKIEVRAGAYTLRATGRVLVFDGFTRVLPQIAAAKDGESEALLPEVKVGERLNLKKLVPSQHFTNPPARYTEASLVKELEKRGIGRPSTYAAIISTIQERGYARLEKRRFYAEKMGSIVTDRLMENFSDLMDFGFTAGMEESLDSVAEAKRVWTDLLDDFYADFSAKLSVAQQDKKGMRGNVPVEIALPCPSCSRPLQIRTASTGVFLGCSGYALPPKERCKKTINLIPGMEIAEDEEAENAHFRDKRRCRLCGTAMDSYLIDTGRQLHICGNNPDCPGYEIEEGSFKLKGYDGPSIVCDKCSSPMQLRTGRFGKYFACVNEECKNTRKLLRNGQAAPPKSDPIPCPELRCSKVEDFFLLRDGAAGLFLAASQFPKNRETRAPLVAELQAHRSELDPKHRYLMDAPAADASGNPTVIRYNRKSAVHYVQSELEGKASGWKAVYEDAVWRVEDGAGAAQKKTAKKPAAAAAGAKESGKAKPDKKASGKKGT